MSIANGSLFRSEALRRYWTREADSTLPKWSRPVMARLRRLRVPIVLQMSEVECGAACLAMILGYFGRRTSISESRETCGHGRDGVSARALVDAAGSFGMRAKAYSLDTTDVEYLPLPAILHWNFNHFVVLERWSPRGATIVDPGSGRKQFTPQQFDEGFTGVALICEPGAGFQPRRSEQSSRAISYLKRIWRVPAASGLMIHALVASLILQVFGLVIPLSTKLLVDHLPLLSNAGALSIFGIGAITVTAGQVALSVFRSRLLILLASRLDAHMMLSFFEHLLALPFRFFQQRSSGDLLMRLGSNATVREALASHSLSAVLDGGFVLVYLVVLLRVAPLFGMVVFAFGALQVTLLAISGRRLRHLSQADLLAQTESQSYLIQALIGIETLKSAGAEDQALAHWSNLFFKQLNTSLQRSRFSEFIESLMLGLRTLSPVCLLYFGGLEVLQHHMNLGTMLALNAMAAAFLQPLASLVSSAQQLQLASIYLERISDVMAAEPEQSRSLVQQAPRLSGNIEIRNVSFRYDADAAPSLRNISLKIKAGQKVALIGRTGSGKSTLAKLLLGLYPVTEGEIFFDDFPLKTLNYRSVRRQWGAVLQDSVVFSGSIRQNIALHNPSISLERVIEAAKKAAIHDEIMQMAMGYETRLDEKGSCLSGGQRQRLSIARSLLHNPRMLLLDEGTSHLDVSTENVINRNLDALHCTRIVIAHRLSTVQNANLIVVIEGGAVVEQGLHADLVNKQGAYAELIRNALDGDSSQHEREAERFQSMPVQQW